MRDLELIHRNNDTRGKNYGTLKMRPELIVRDFRTMQARRDPVEAPYICTPRRPRIPWHQKIDWNVVSKITAFACAVVIGLVAVYWLVGVAPQFVEMMRWR